MINEKFKEIHNYCLANQNAENIKKYSRYFKDGFKGYGLDFKIFENKRKEWFVKWNSEMTMDEVFALGELLVKTDMYEEVSTAIMLVAERRKDFSITVFKKLGRWFDIGINNWAHTDILCMFVFPYFIIDKVIDFKHLFAWKNSSSEWQRRTIPVTLVEFAKKDLDINIAFRGIEPLMNDKSEYVQKGIGTLLRTLWKNYPKEIENFLLKWKDTCGRLIVQYATEKMSKDSKAKFKKVK